MKLSDVVLAENGDGSKVIHAIGNGPLMAQRPDGTILNDPATGVPKVFGSRTQAEAWLAPHQSEEAASSNRRMTQSS